ncbi:MAG: hypothetical protein U5R46_12870 [Gammaproteobacteria bacterium]|nr:hypothetical protein [Gammaproteobacteria bacterium]
MLNEILLAPGNAVDTEESSGPHAGAGDGFRQESRALKYLAAVWALRMIRRRPALFRSRAGFADEHQVLALTGLPESLIGTKSSRRIVGVIRERLEKLEAAPVPLAGPLFENTAELSARLQLEPAETALLLFAVVLRGSEGLDSIFDALGNVTKREMILELSNALGYSPEAVRRALSREAVLASAGVLWVDTGSCARIGRKLDCWKAWRTS